MSEHKLTISRILSLFIYDHCFSSQLRTPKTWGSQYVPYESCFQYDKYNTKPMLRCPWVKLQAKYASNTSSIIVPSYQFLFVCSSISSPHTPCHYSTLWSLSPNIQYFGCRKQPDAIKSLELFTIFFFLICCVSSTWLLIDVHQWPNVFCTILKVCQITLPNKSK